VGSEFQEWWEWITCAHTDFYKRALQALVDLWQKCIANGGDALEK